jgi:hypothetical protein
MGSVADCLSLTPILRCVGLSLNEEVFALIPAGLEVIFSLGLVFAGRNAGRYVLQSRGFVDHLINLSQGLVTFLPQRV